MQIINLILEKRVTTLVFTAALFLGGMQAYFKMSRLEDPEFIIKSALVVTPYHGATALEVEQEVTDEMESAIQQLGQLDEIESRSVRGMSTITATIQDKYDGEILPQIWDELRRKVNDAQRKLPPGAGPSLVIDDYGDVYGVLLVLYGSEFSHAELKRVTDLMRRELLMVEDVAKIETFGERREAFYVALNRERMALTGVTAELIARELKYRNLVGGAGRVKVGGEEIALYAEGGIRDVEDIKNLMFVTENGRKFYLRDVATVRRGYVEPRSEAIHYGSDPAIALGISTVSGGNVMTMGKALQERLQTLKSEIPLGMEIGFISMQSEAVKVAIDGFVMSLIQAVVIVIGVLLIFMGMGSGLLIGAVLVVTIVGSLLLLEPMGVALERVSLGALIIALGMLVDNAIVVVDGILVGMQRGKQVMAAAVEVVRQSALPLLGATLIAVLTFAAIGTSQDRTGELTRSLFQVILVSLLLSWVVAVTTTPLLAVLFLRKPKETKKDPFDRPFYRFYQGLLKKMLRYRGVTVLLIGALFVASVLGFTQVRQSFFPPSTRPQFQVDFWMPQGTHFDETERQALELASEVDRLPGVKKVTTLVGKGSLRFILTYGPEKQNSAYAQLLVDVEDSRSINRLIEEVEAKIAANHPEALGYAYKFEIGPGSVGKIQARFSGPDSKVLRKWAEQAVAILEAEPGAHAPRIDWRQPVKTLRAQLIEAQARPLGIDHLQVARLLQRSFEGQPVGVYREGDLLLPIILRPPEAEHALVDSVRSLQIWSPVAGRHVPLTQVVSGFETVGEESLIIRQDRQRTLTVLSDPRGLTASELLERVRPAIEAIPHPPGYQLVWEGEYKNTRRAKSALAKSLPFFLALMVLVTVGLFNSVRQPLVIWACVPLATIGVTSGLLATGQPFGFMALLGFLSLTGMLIKNAIVLIDEINAQLSAGAERLDAIINACTSRLRPVALAASTTAFGMIPLFFDAFFVAMAVTIVFGLLCATALTMLVVPVFYAILYRVERPPR